MKAYRVVPVFTEHILGLAGRRSGTSGQLSPEIQADPAVSR